MTEDDWNSVIDPAIELIRQRARESIDSDATPQAIRQKITDYQQENLQRANHPKYSVKAALLEYAKSPL